VLSLVTAGIKTGIFGVNLLLKSQYFLFSTTVYSEHRLN
jgi:hypothetical protein